VSDATIVFLDRDTLPSETVLRPPAFPHRLIAYPRTAPEEVAARIAEADVVVTNKVQISADAVAAAKRLRLIAVAATGYDKVDVAACTAAGVTVCNIRDYATRSVPEHTFALILALRRSLVAYRDSVNAGRWEDAAQFCYFDHPIADLAGATLGIVGAGTLGQAVARLGEAFGMRVLFAARKDAARAEPPRVLFDTMLRESDVISLHCPLSEATRNLISRREFALMARKPLLINTARGGLVDENALAEALQNGRIAGAGFDVATREPPGADHVLRRLATRPDVILTPHVAWASREAIQGLADQLIGNIEAFWCGEPRNVVI